MLQEFSNMDEVSTFTAPAGMNVRVVTIDGNPWFVAADVCRALEGARSGLSYLASRFRCPHRENWTLVAWIPTHDCSSLRLILRVSTALAMACVWSATAFMIGLASASVPPRGG